MTSRKSPPPSKNLSRLFSDEHDGDSGEKLPEEELAFGEGNYVAIHHTCEAIGQIIESWGFKKILGMTWAFLYLCPEPASAKDICKALDISPALVSITLQDLLRWQVVKNCLRSENVATIMSPSMTFGK